MSSYMDMYTQSFIDSAKARSNIFQDLEETRQWLQFMQQNNVCKVEQISLADLDHWHFDTDTGNLRHSSGKFFSVVGLDCRPTYSGVMPWQQPIISQPEVGILGILTKEFDGIRYFLMQAKMEPGNINQVQISPTLQATHSNYTQAHKGKSPPYLEYFLDPNARVIRSQLQSETGSRFLGKHNRNILLHVTAEVDVLPGYRWLTLHEIQSLMTIDNAINMDSRSVLSNISFSGGEHQRSDGVTEFFRSASCGPSAACRSREELNRWLNSMRRQYAIATRQIPLNSVQDWVRDERGIHHATRNYFTVAGVRVQAAEREVARWDQPLLKHEGLGLAGFLCADIGGVLHFLLQAKPEPGIVGSVELAPAVSVFDYVNRPKAADTVPFMEYFLEPNDADILHSSIQSEEGGRFWNLCNHFLVIKVESSEAIRCPDRYEWLTLEQLQQFSQGDSMVNSEARTLLSCLPHFH